MSRVRSGSLLSGMAGVLIGAVLVAGVPAIAATGDTAKMGQWNRAGKQTVFSAAAGTTLQVRNTKATGIPLRLIGDAAMPPMEVTSDVMVDNLNADLVDGFDANGLIRSASGFAADAADTNGAAASATIVAPAAGYLLITGGLDVLGNGTDDTFTCQLKVGTSVVPGSGRSLFVNSDDTTCSTSGAFTVAAGSHTVTLDIADRETVLLYQSSVWVIFVPFDGTGSIPPPPDQ